MLRKHLETVPRTEKGLIEVDFVGLHFALMKPGVLEAVGYPWFMPYNRVVGQKQFFPCEDIGFCLRARGAGVRIFVNPSIRVGHEKSQVIWP